MVDPGPEWVNHVGQSTDRTRVGKPTNALLFDGGLSTELDWRNVDYSGVPISGKSKSQFYRMRKWQKRSRHTGAKERALSEGFRIIENYCLENVTPPRLVVNVPANIYRKAQAEGAIRGRSIATCSVASLYIANQLFKTGRTVEDFAKASKIPNKEIGRVLSQYKEGIKN